MVVSVVHAQIVNAALEKELKTQQTNSETREQQLRSVSAQCTALSAEKSQLLRVMAEKVRQPQTQKGLKIWQLCKTRHFSARPN